MSYFLHISRLISMDIGKQRRHDQEADMDDWSSVRGPKHEKDREEMNRSSISGHKDSSSSSAKWKCSDQMWVMRKTKQPSTCPESNSTECHKASSYSPTWQHRRRRRPSDNTNRVCSDCSTTTTPLWRSGPNGPKSLCNACGIRQRKARKAMEAEDRGWCAKTRIVHNNKRQVIMKNKSDYECRGKRKVTLRDFEFNFSRNSVVFQQPVFPRDEVIEGAMLLMDLSSGLFPF